MMRRNRIRVIAACIGALPASASFGQIFNDDVVAGQSAERHFTGDDPLTLWSQDADFLDVNRGDTIGTRAVEAEVLETVKLTGVVPPIHFESGVAEIPDSTVEDLRRILATMEARRNVRLHLVGHADSQPLSSGLAAVFGDNEGLSRERAGEVAELLQTTLALPPDAVSYEWAGDTKPVASNDTAAGRAENRRVEVEIWYDEVGEGQAVEEFLVEQSFDRIKVCRMETVCKLSYADGHERRARIQNVLAPLRYDEAEIEVSETYIASIRDTLANMSDRSDVVVRFVGYTDDTPLAERNERIYGDHLGLSAARARRVAQAIQEALNLPAESVESDGRGTERPLGSNDTAQGRALNRRVEVEFWYDDPLQQLPDEPMVCPAEGDGTLVTRVYDPPWGVLAPIVFENGDFALPAGLTAGIGRALADVEGRRNVRVRFVGYTRNEGLERRTAMVYGDDIGLSAARARRVMDQVAAEMGLPPESVAFEGRGFVSSPDVVNAGFVQGDVSEVVAEIVYDEIAESTELDGVNIAPLRQELDPQNPFGLNLMRITVDGKPIDDPERSFADIQRCTDVALEEADIRFSFDNLRANPRLSISAEPKSVPFVEEGGELLATSSVRFAMYANYAHFIESAEIRIFDGAQSVHETPLETLPIAIGGFAEWTPPAERFRAPLRELKFVLRAYAPDGSFDETLAQPLWLTYLADGEFDPAALAAINAAPTAANVAPETVPVSDSSINTADQAFALVPYGVTADAATILTPDEALALALADYPPAAALAPPTEPPTGQLLDAYGETGMAVRNIVLGSGTVTVQGADVPEGHSVYVAGQPIPIDPEGNFVAETILPTGLHTVEVAVLDENGNGELYLRDLEFKQDDWFYVGMADLTFAQNDATGPIELFQGANPTLEYDESAYGRVAFYVNGKFGDQWKLEASADSREAPLDDLFSNFTDKSPDALFRRIDPDYYYPTFGDDSIVDENAPTQGRAYVRLDKGENYGLWGNFGVGYMQNELTQIDRGLYGGMAHFEFLDNTSFGESRLALDSFVAEPGTVPSREEFRGTGGSLYFLRRQDILTGSERVRIEIRDKASGIVTGVVNLRPVLDYDIDYLQGRILLNTPLNSTVDDNLLVRSNALSGDEAYLVIRYEYTPGFDELDALSVGGQVHYWVNDHVQVGFTGNSNEQGDVDSSLTGADVTLRKTERTWLKLQQGQSEGFLTGAMRSDDGGFGFYGYDDAAFSAADASASRVDLSLGLDDYFAAHQGQLTLYGQETEAGYAAPGLQTLTDTRNYGGSFAIPVTGSVSLNVKSDVRIYEQGIETEARELNVAWNLTDQWSVSTGFREDFREDHSAVVPLTQVEGERRDGIVQVGYDSRGQWSAYAFAQETMAREGTLEENGRFGVGSAYQLSERLGLDFEVSDGDLGRGGKIGTNYMHSDRTSVYLNYVLENERTDNAYRAGTGSEGRLVAGARTRFSDSASVFLEERYQTNDAVTGLTHSAGINYTATEQLNISANTDIGTLQDVNTGAKTDRTAAGVAFGYGFGDIQVSTGFEYRVDDVQAIDLSISTRETRVFRNSFKYQINPALRLLGKYNTSDSESTDGQLYDGEFTEAVFGTAFRPVVHDRFNVLLKFTYFYNVPTTEQVALHGTSVEFIQKSRITSVDFGYDIGTDWTIGAKFAERDGELALDRVNREFFSNGARLVILRADWEFRPNWEAVIESRTLNMVDLDEQRTGALLVISRSLGEHLKVGLGYNFTDFSDDLTDLDFNHQGAFLSLTGAM
jgi:flagellar motor protein MotB